MTLEQLLNKLIEKGWRPRGKKVELYGTGKDTFGEKIVIFNGNAGGFKRWGCTYRELVSKESGLWQFVCENRLIEPDHMKQYNGYEYWLCECALCNEEDLEKFLIENIKSDF